MKIRIRSLLSAVTAWGMLRLADPALSNSVAALPGATPAPLELLNCSKSPPCPFGVCPYAMGCIGGCILKAIDTSSAAAAGLLPE